MGEHSIVFSLQDVRTFAHISGDHNPIHVDPITARRLIFGGAVAHGLFVVCWVIDRLAAEGLPVANLSRLRVSFRQPVFIDRKINLTVTQGSSQTKAVVTQDGTTCTVINLEFGDAPNRSEIHVSDHAIVSGDPKPLTAEKIAQARGTISLGYDKADLAALFPLLSQEMPPLGVAQLLALTRIVGMECPGERSLFCDFEVQFGNSHDQGPLSFEVTEWDPRFKLVTIDVRGAGIRATLRALLRSDPVRQPETDELRSFVTGKPFQDQQALVVGGSRGIGEVCAKLLALGGVKHICLTYATGAKDAQVVASDLANYCEVHLARFDVLRDKPPEGTYTHIYYFAAPRLRANIGPFNMDLFQFYNQYFVNGMALLFEAYSRKTAVHLLQPSSLFVEIPERGFSEYATSKGASESLGRQLVAQYPSSVILTPRLPRVRTDQTQNVSNCNDTAAILMPSLLELSMSPARSRAAVSSQSREIQRQW